MSVSSVNTATAPQFPLAAQQAAKAQYLRTGIDKDAAAGDPDHDAPRKLNLKSSGPAARLSSSSATIANAVPSQAATPATASAAYAGKAG